MTQLPGVGLKRRSERGVAQAEADRSLISLLLGERQLLRAADSRNDPCANAVPYHLAQK